MIFLKNFKIQHQPQALGYLLGFEIFWFCQNLWPWRPFERHYPKKNHFRNNLCLYAHISGVEWNFAKLPKGDSISLACWCYVQNFRSLAPQEAELRPFKEGNPQPIFTIFECSYSSNHISGLEWNFPKFQRLKSIVWPAPSIDKGPRSTASQGVKLWPLKVDIDCIFESIF